jgi:hypothetical protein
MITFLYLYYLKRIWLLGNLATENSARLLRPSLWGSPFWHSIHKVKYFFKLGVRFKIKNGSCILFWTDWWTGDSPLSAWFMCLFDIAAMGGSTIPLAWASAQACQSTRGVCILQLCERFYTINSILDMFAQVSKSFYTDCSWPKS